MALKVVTNAIMEHIHLEKKKTYRIISTETVRLKYNNVINLCDAKG
jgi:hypothetical protein